MPMRRSPKLRPTVWDGLAAVCVIALAVACAAAFWAHGALAQGTLTAVVSMDGKEVDRVDLSREGGVERTYVSHGYTLHVFAQGSEIRVSQADCPTQDCVHTGFIDQAGQSIVCLPARVVIQLVRTDGADGGGVDAVVG